MSRKNLQKYILPLEVKLEYLKSPKLSLLQLSVTSFFLFTLPLGTGSVCSDIGFTPQPRLHLSSAYRYIDWQSVKQKKTVIVNLIVFDKIDSYQNIPIKSHST